MKLSIIVPLYNKEKYVKSTIESVLSQTFNDWELLIVDNGSTDRSLEKAKTIEDARIQYLKSPVQGVGAARNYGLNSAKGEWIQFLDADDLLESSHLYSLLEVATHNPHADIIAGGWQEFVDGSPNHRITKRPAGEKSKSPHLLSDSAIAYAPWAVHAAIIRKAILTPENSWPVELDRYLAEDIVFWFTLVCQFSTAYCDTASALYRLQTAGRSQGNYSSAWYEGVNIAIKRNIDFLKYRNIPITIYQCETLTRFYGNLYQFSKWKNFLDTSDIMLSEANIWLNQWFTLSTRFKLPLFLRKLFGMRLFSYLELYWLSLRRFFS
jgi:glycosyltransferase involved in cell wall biosynthesis